MYYAIVFLKDRNVEK